MPSIYPMSSHLIIVHVRLESRSLPFAIIILNSLLSHSIDSISLVSLLYSYYLVAIERFEPAPAKCYVVLDRYIHSLGEVPNFIEKGLGPYK